MFAIKLKWLELRRQIGWSRRTKFINSEGFITKWWVS